MIYFLLTASLLLNLLASLILLTGQQSKDIRVLQRKVKVFEGLCGDLLRLYSLDSRVQTLVKAAQRSTQSNKKGKEVFR